jgi:hypothetical protein
LSTFIAFFSSAPLKTIFKLSLLLLTIVIY